MNPCGHRTETNQMPHERQRKRNVDWPTSIAVTTRAPAAPLAPGPRSRAKPTATVTRTRTIGRRRRIRAASVGGTVLRWPARSGCGRRRDAVRRRGGSGRGCCRGGRQERRASLWRTPFRCGPTRSRLACGCGLRPATGGRHEGRRPCPLRARPRRPDLHERLSGHGRRRGAVSGRGRAGRARVTPSVTGVREGLDLRPRRHRLRRLRLPARRSRGHRAARRSCPDVDR